MFSTEASIHYPHSTLSFTLLNVVPQLQVILLFQIEDVVFIVGAIWNLICSVPLIILSFFNINLAAGLIGVKYVGHQFWFAAFFITVAFFGIGYLWVGLNLDDNHFLIVLATLLKILVFIFFLVYHLEGYFPLILVFDGTVDLIFSFLFIEFLLKYNKS